MNDKISIKKINDVKNKGILSLLFRNIKLTTMNKLISTIYWNYFLAYNVYNWTPEDVGQWLESRSLSEYKDSFIRNEIRGTELLTLDKGDLQVRRPIIV